MNVANQNINQLEAPMRRPMDWLIATYRQEPFAELRK